MLRPMWRTPKCTTIVVNSRHQSPWMPLPLSASVRSVLMCAQCWRARCTSHTATVNATIDTVTGASSKRVRSRTDGGGGGALPCGSGDGGGGGPQGEGADGGAGGGGGAGGAPRPGPPHGGGGPAAGGRGGGAGAPAPPYGSPVLTRPTVLRRSARS